MNKLRVAVIGAGRLGGFHAQKIAARNDVELTAVVDPLPEARRRLADKYGAAPVADHRCLRGRIDAAVIAAPTTLHYAVARDLLEMGVHLLVEKPLCTTRAECDALLEISARRGLTLQVGHVERFNPVFEAALPEIRAPKFIQTIRSHGLAYRSTDVGVVLDLMIHDIELALAMVRRPVVNVEAVGLSVLGGHEDIAHARLEFEDGCVAILTASRISYESQRRMQVWSERAFADVDFAARTIALVRPSETLLRRQFSFNNVAPKHIEEHWSQFLDEHLPREQKAFEAVDALSLELDDFINSIRTRQQPRVDGATGRDAVCIAELLIDRISGSRHVIPAPHFRAAPLRASA